VPTIFFLWPHWLGPAMMGLLGTLKEISPSRIQENWANDMHFRVFFDALSFLEFKFNNQ
jgi:hypothetical protein